ncbi:MAG: hypothetical protein RIS18_327 [Actinomycetota bacterium]|jgi:hypothetical protein
MKQNSSKVNESNPFGVISLYTGIKLEKAKEIMDSI